MATAETEAIAYSLPSGTDSADVRRRTIPVPIVAGTSTAIIDIGFTLCWISITSDVDVRVRSDVVNDASFGVSLVGDWPIWAKSYQNHWVSTDRYLRFRGLADAGVVYVYVSNR